MKATRPRNVAATSRTAARASASTGPPSTKRRAMGRPSSSYGSSASKVLMSARSDSERTRNQCSNSSRSPVNSEGSASPGAHVSRGTPARRPSSAAWASSAAIATSMRSRARCAARSTSARGLGSRTVRPRSAAARPRRAVAASIRRNCSRESRRRSSRSGPSSCRPRICSASLPPAPASAKSLHSGGERAQEAPRRRAARRSMRASTRARRT
mmetsp:Transcript_74679/g.236062  ORF Transcript_74679/g.236062 Transcript_74679/m.236062 type:complete len:213 (-) Transcript_74679:208-846(-)